MFNFEIQSSILNRNHEVQGPIAMGSEIKCIYLAKDVENGPECRQQKNQQEKCDNC